MSEKRKPMIKIRPKAQVAERLPSHVSTDNWQTEIYRPQVKMCPINQDSYLEFVFMLNKTGKLNVNQVSYLTEYMENENDLWSKLEDMNLRNAFISWNDKIVKDEQNKALQASIVADHLKSLKKTLTSKEKELEPQQTQLESLTDELEMLNSRYRNYPENPRYINEKTRLENNISTLNRDMLPLSEHIKRIQTEIQTIMTSN